MTRTPITLQTCTKTERQGRTIVAIQGGVYALCKPQTLRAAYELAKQNDGAPGTDGVTFEAMEVDGVEPFLDQLRERSNRPEGPRRVGIPKERGKVRQLSIPSIRDRVVQGALKLILEPIFEADLQPGSNGYRPKKSAHAAVQRVSEPILEGKEYRIAHCRVRPPFRLERPHNPCREAGAGARSAVIACCVLCDVHWKWDYGDSYPGTQGETPNTAKEPPTDYRASARSC